MKSVKVSTGNSPEPSIFRKLAEEFLETKKAISCLPSFREDTSSYVLFYEEMYNNHSEQIESDIQSNYSDDEHEYGYLGYEGIAMFLLFLAEYEENP